MPITITEVVALDIRFPTSDSLDGSDAAGWIGYSDEKIRRLSREGVAAGWRHFKVKVGADRAADVRRVGIVREEIGADAGGVGLCEYVQHLAIFDYIAVTGSLEDRVVEYVDHLHEHFEAPAIVQDGRYGEAWAPVTASGRSR